LQIAMVNFGVHLMYAFIHIEKTAGTTLHSILRRSFGVRHCDIRLPVNKRGDEKYNQFALIEADDLRRVQRLYRSLVGISGHNVKVYGTLPAECPELRFFTFLRDPVRRYRSHLLTRSGAHLPAEIDNWIADSWHHNWQTKMIAGEPSADKALELIAKHVAFVGLTERFDESVLMLGQWLGEPRYRPQYRQENRWNDPRRLNHPAHRPTDMDYLDSEPVRARIQAVNEADQKVYDFVTATIFPRQLATFQGDLQTQLDQLRQKNRVAGDLAEPVRSRLRRNYVYKPLLHFGMM
jgi:hypothetical protein